MTDKEQQWVTGGGMDLLGRQNSGSADTAEKQRLLVVGNGLRLLRGSKTCGRLPHF